MPLLISVLCITLTPSINKLIATSREIKNMYRLKAVQKNYCGPKKVNLPGGEYLKSRKEYPSFLIPRIEKCFGTQKP